MNVSHSYSECDLTGLLTCVLSKCRSRPICMRGGGEGDRGMRETKGGCSLSQLMIVAYTSNAYTDKRT